MFQGFSQRTGDFIWGLTMNNYREWFMANKDEFESALNQPFRALAADTLSRMRERFPEMDFQCHVSRIYRDARRLFGRGPYKDHLWFTLQSAERRSIGPVFWFEIEGTGYSYGMGCWDSTADMMEVYRALIDENPARFEALVAIAERCEGYRLWGEMYKRLKADRGERLNPWYNRKYVSVGWEYPFGGELFSEALPDTLAGRFGELMPMYRFFMEVWNRTLALRAAQLDLAKT